MLEKVKEWIKKAETHLEYEFSKLQLGRANPSLVEDIMVDSYGSLQPLKNSASVSVMDPQTLNIKPWDKSMLQAIAKWISDSWMGLNPQSMADSIIIKVPSLTEERRKEVANIAKKLTEEAKVWIRNARADSHKLIKKAEDDKEISEDEAKDLSSELQKIVDFWNKKVDELFKIKEGDIMKV